MSNIREEIARLLEITPRLNKAAKVVLHENSDVAAVARYYGLDYWILIQKLQILKRLNDYYNYKNKFHVNRIYNIQLAINDIVRDRLSVSNAAKKYCIDKVVLDEELKKFGSKSNMLAFILTKQDGVFTFPEEEMLYKLINITSCVFTSLKYLPSMAYLIAKKINKPYPSEWDKTKKVDEIWVLEFQMRFGLKNTYGEPGPSTLCTHLQKSIISSQYFNGHVISTVRERIARHLEMSPRLHKAAKEVLYKNKDVATVARYYELDCWMFNQKVQILRREFNYCHYFKYQIVFVDYFESAVNDILRCKLSVSDAAKKYCIDRVVLEEELKKFDSKSSMLKFILTTEDGVFTFPEEVLLFKQLCLWKKDSQCVCRFCALEHLPSLAYQFAKKNNIPYPSEWNKNAKADEIWLFEFEMRFNLEISKAFDDLCKKNMSPASTNISQSSSLFNERVISNPSTLCADLQGNFGSLQFSVQMLGSRIRERIARHLKMSPRLHKAAKEVIYENKLITDIALKYKLGFWIFKRKVQIIKETNIYLDLKSKFENAICEVLKQSAYVTDIAKKYGIDERHLRAELMEYLHLCRTNNILYKYGRIIEQNMIFTFSQEESLLKLLNTGKRSECPCQVCKLEHLLKLAYSFAKKNQIRYPPEWNINEQADEFWLYEFEMRYSTEIIQSADSCTKKLISARASTSGYHSSSPFDQQEISAPSTSYTHVQGGFGLLKFSNANISTRLNMRKRIKKHTKLREIRIKKHLQLSKRFHEAAKQVLDKNKDIASVARRYKLNYWIFNRKVQILRRKFTYYHNLNHQTVYVDYLETAINDISRHKLSVSDAAKKYYYITRAALEEFIKSDSKSSKLKLILTTEDGVFTFREEDLLFKKLCLWKKDSQCVCRFCALDHLPSLAYQFAKKNNIPYPPEWNKKAKADEIWVFEFEMRHSITISGTFSHKCLLEKEDV